MDAAHEQELARILSKRKEGGRLLPGSAGGMGGGSSGSRAPLAAPERGGDSPPPPLIPAAGPPSKQQQIANGEIVVDRAQQQQQQGSSVGAVRVGGMSTSATSAAAGGNRYQQPPVPSSSGNNDLARVLDEIQQQNRRQAEQLKSLQGSIDNLMQNRGGARADLPLQHAGSSSSSYQQQPPPPPGRVGPPGRVVSPPPGVAGRRTAAAVANNDDDEVDRVYQAVPYNSDGGRKPPILGAYDQHMVNMSLSPDHGGGDHQNDIAKQLLIQDATALGLVVKPRSFVTTAGAGSRMIQFRSPSRNQLGGATNRSVFGRSSPSRGGRPTSPNQQQQQHGGGSGRARSIPGFGSPQTNRGADGQVVGGEGMRLTRATRARQNPSIAKPFSYSTVDVDSATVLLATGDWFFKLRVAVNASSIVGPAGWQIINSVPRYVYLDRVTYMIKWGDKPGGSATIVSHYVPIDHIVAVNIYAQADGATAEDGIEPRILYYIVLHVVEGGFHARGRASQRRMCVFATERRGKADMWYDALQSISTFYRSRGAAMSLTTKTFSSD